VEFALTDKWSAKAEYMHYDFSAKTYMINQIPAYSNISASGDYVTIGVNYHLGSLLP
jgi:opacity protein-like surface antigen